jgi:O-methyltransferase
MWPGTYLAYVPDRYNDNYRKYRAAGGAMAPDELRAFLAGNRTNNGGDQTRFYFLALICDQVAKERLGGDIAELGVYKGNTAVLLARLARQLDRTAYLFDTYEGFSGADLVGIDRNKSQEFTDTSLAGVRAKVGDEHVRYVAGYFPDTASQVPDDARFCLVHLDCDLYAPFAAGLRYFYPRLVEGGFLVKHDYSSLYWAGAEQAIDEFFADLPEKPIPIPDKSGTAVIRKASHAKATT